MKTFYREKLRISSRESKKYEKISGGSNYVNISAIRQRKILT